MTCTIRLEDENFKAFMGFCGALPNLYYVAIGYRVHPRKLIFFEDPQNFYIHENK